LKSKQSYKKDTLDTLKIVDSKRSGQHNCYQLLKMKVLFKYRILMNSQVAGFRYSQILTYSLFSGIIPNLQPDSPRHLLHAQMF